jgi:hypothetical protein
MNSNPKLYVIVADTMMTLLSLGFFSRTNPSRIDVKAAAPQGMNIR